MLEHNKYQLALANLAYGHGKPENTGRLKQDVSDFNVSEIMDLELTGAGEHVWLDISKTRLSTDQVAKALARHAGVAFRDVGYAGMKDVFAITRQWFSVWQPKDPAFDWRSFKMDGVEVHAITKHNRKLKRGAHKGNFFSIRLVDLTGELDHLEQRLLKVRQAGVPNYFGEQRFGRQANNLLKAEQLFSNEIRIKDRNLKGIVLSAARSFVFNTVVSERVSNSSWTELMHNEPAALDGGNAIFASKQEPANQGRLAALDIHPTAPMWGRGALSATQEYAELAHWESEHIAQYKLLQEGLERNGLNYQRRAIRSVPKSLKSRFQDNTVTIEFSLQAGQFATSIVRELISQEPN